MRDDEIIGRKVLLFGFEDLRTVLAVGAALGPFGADLVDVGTDGHGKTLGALAGLEDSGTVPEGERGLPVGRMAVLCGLQEDLDALLPALARAGAGPGCLKAVLTVHNRSWGPGRLYQELSAERRAVEGTRRG